MIVVEGFDFSGKSTLAKALGDRLGWPVVHTGGPTADVDDVRRCLRRSRERFSTKNVQDRTTHISEACYSAFSHPDKAALALDSLREVTHAWLVIYCRPDIGKMVDQFLAHHVPKSHDDMRALKQTMSDAKHIAMYYDTVMALVGEYTTVIRYDRNEPGALEKMVIEATARVGQ